MAEYLNTMTIPMLREVAGRMGLTIPGKARKAEVIAYVSAGISIARNEAEEHNATLDEAYAHRAEAAGITMPAFLACKRGHAARGDIKIGAFWACCTAQPRKVVVFDDGSRQAVCEKDANTYMGTVEDLPVGSNVACETCGEEYRVPLTREKAEADFVRAIDLTSGAAMSPVDRATAYIGAYWLNVISEDELKQRDTDMRNAFGLDLFYRPTSVPAMA